MIRLEAILCFDGIKGRQLRGVIYEDYKSARNKGLEVKASEHEGKDTRKIFTKVGIDLDEDLPIRWSYRYEESKEADDLIAELTMEYLLNGYNVVILSADTDLFQMLRYPQVRLHNFKKEITANDVEESTGVKPQIYADWKALVGDSSDSIPVFRVWVNQKRQNYFKILKKLKVFLLMSLESIMQNLLWN